MNNFENMHHPVNTNCLSVKSTWGVLSTQSTCCRDAEQKDEIKYLDVSSQKADFCSVKNCKSREETSLASADNCVRNSSTSVVNTGQHHHHPSVLYQTATGNSSLRHYCVERHSLMNSETSENRIHMSTTLHYDFAGTSVPINSFEQMMTKVNDKVGEHNLATCDSKCSTITGNEVPLDDDTELSLPSPTLLNSMIVGFQSKLDFI